MTQTDNVVDIRRAAVDELERRELSHPDSNLTTRSARKGPEIGSTGLKVFGGIVTEEHNTAWQQPELYTTVDKMRKGDATIASILLAITLPILATEVYVDAKSLDGSEADPIVEEAAEFIRYNLFSGEVMTRDFLSTLRETMLFLAYGHYPFEKVFQRLTTGQYSGMMAWQKMAPRHPRTITEWHTNRVGDLQRVRQQVQESEFLLDVPIKRSKLLLFTNQPEAGNPLGISVLRPAFKHWKYKDGFYAVQAIAIERQGAGVPYAKYPAGTPDPEKDKAEEMLQNIQAHEQSYFTYEDDWEVGFMDMGSASVLNPQDAIDHHDSSLAKSVLAGFMQLPQDGKGSFALSSDQSGFFNHALNEVTRTVSSEWNTDAIPQLLDMNFPNLPAYPKLRFDRVGHISIDKILEHIARLAEKGVLTSDLDLENRVRDMLNYPPVSEEDFEEAREEPEPEPAPAPAGG